MKNSARCCSVAARTSPGWGNGALAALALVMISLAGCSGGSPDPRLAPGERALVGSYNLDHVLLASGKLVVLPNCNPLFVYMSVTLEQAAQKGLLNATQLTVLKRQDCTMTILADHSFVISNLPSADLTQTFSVKGTWSMEVYHAFETYYGYRISLKCPGYKGPALHAKFLNADKPNPPILQIFFGDLKKDTVVFRVSKADWQPGPRRSR